MTKHLIISPSGNLYGSEQVLIDYLSETKLHYTVVVPKNSQLYNKLKTFISIFKIKTFKPENIKSFYIGQLFKLFVNPIHTVYINEAGHCKYILILAKIFAKKKFVIHVRIIEDTHSSRWKTKLPKNVTVLVISKYLQSNLCVPSILVNDPYRSMNASLPNKKIQEHKLIIGVIGRITLTKGFLRYLDLLEYIKSTNKEHLFHFQFYGNFVEDITDVQKQKLLSYSNVEVKGFVKNITEIYNCIDCVMHLSTQEGLGRIVFEAIDFHKPFIGINAAGVGEVASNLELEDFLISKDNVILDSIEKLMQFHTDYVVWQEKVTNKKNRMLKMYNATSYNNTIDNILSHSK